MELLEEDYRRHQEYVISATLSDPTLLRLEDEPRYRALLHKINFPASSSKTR